MEDNKVKHPRGCLCDYHKKLRERFNKHSATALSKAGIAPTGPEPDPLLVSLRDAVKAAGGEFEDDWEKELREWLVAEFPNLLKVYQCVGTVIDENGGDSEDKGTADWFVKVFPKMLPLWLRVEQEIKIRNNKQSDDIR